ncbi:hypothetical protein ASD45_01610 [Pseudolabrys sp. Root1462]|uniref:VOC family protein n=1 Tax=Pseudolabrys sp. Root1462 TaxID=1736466 RepID=UPI0007038E1E|nr:VOC family protein [Pseudolabrys sp. Root1462]KQY99633.1 hypothetical protein ASD45_01610 [Pseudolabrys sp. Root1462]
MSLALPLDHVVVLVRDLSAAGAAFEAAGFAVTRETRHSAEMGTANRCIMLNGSYVELMGIVAETPANTTWRELLASGAGVRGIAFRSDDVDAAAAALAEQGIKVGPVRNFSRTTGDGELKFSVVRIDSAETPGMQCLVCQHHTPDLLWRPDAMRHTNGASRLTTVTFPEAGSLSKLVGDAGIAIFAGAARLAFAGKASAYHDLDAVCGIEVEVVAS